MTENATAGILFGDDVLEVMSNGWPRLAGEYLILRRALKRNAIDSVDIFMVPDLLIGDVSDEQEGRVR